MGKATAAKMSKMPDSLRQKMARAVSGSAPSLLPPGIGGAPEAASVKGAGKPAKQKEEKPTLQQLMKEGMDRRNLAALIEQQADLNSQKKALVAQLEPIEDDIKALLNSYGISGSLLHGDCNVSYSPQQRTTIDETLLLSEGIQPEVIDRCKKTSFSKTLTITRKN